MTKALLINPSYQPSYGGTKASIVNPFFPTLGLATIAATAKQHGHEVEILDLCWRPYDFEFIRSSVKEIKPDIVGIHATTPLMNQLRDISLIKKAYKRAITFNPGFALQRIYRALSTGQLLNEIYYAFKFFTNPVHDNPASIYYGRERWPVYDFESNPPTRLPYLEVKSKQKAA